MLLSAMAMLAPTCVHAERIRDLVTVQGVRSNSLMGYGLVVGLDGTGDQTMQAPFTGQSLNNMLSQLGITVPAGTNMQLKNIAAVMVTAEMPAFARPGDRIDIVVSSLGNAKSLRGGTLLMTPLKGADAQIYALAQGNPPRPLRPVPLLKVKPKATVEEGMRSGFLLALSQWQYHEELWLRGVSGALPQIKDALETLRQVFSLYGALVPRKASSDLRQKLTVLEEALLEENVSAEKLCFSPVWLETQLALTNWIVTEGWRAFVDQKADAKLQGSFKRFSDIMLGRIAADLKETFAHVNHSGEYQDKLTRLHRQLLAVHLLAGAYQPDVVNSWLQSWQQLQQAIVSQQEVWLDSHRQQALKQAAFWKNGSV